MHINVAYFRPRKGSSSASTAVGASLLQQQELPADSWQRSDVVNQSGNHKDGCLINGSYLSIYLSIHPSIHPSIYLSIYLSMYILMMYIYILYTPGAMMYLLQTWWRQGRLRRHVCGEHLLGLCDAR